MNILLGLEPFQKFGEVGGGWCWWSKVILVFQTLDLDLKLGPSWTIAVLVLVSRLDLKSLNLEVKTLRKILVSVTLLRL